MTLRWKLFPLQSINYQGDDGVIKLFFLVADTDEKKLECLLLTISLQTGLTLMSKARSLPLDVDVIMLLLPYSQMLVSPEKTFQGQTL
jgi:hypothetical protein